jgi:hypothetical protein
MKPLFAIDITEDKNSEEINGREFVVATTSEATQMRLEESMASVETLESAASLPWWLQILRTLFFGYAILYFGILLTRIIEVGFFEALRVAVQNTPVLLALAFLSLIAGCVTILIASRRRSAVTDSADTEQILNALDAQVQCSYAELGVPADATDTDVMFFRYKMKDGVPVVKSPGFQMTTHFNLNMKAYRTEDALMLAELECLYAFPLSELKSIQRIKEKASVHAWNKEVGPNEEPYKQYKLTVNGNFGSVHFKHYYVLTLLHEGEELGIYFPPYELPIFEELTGLRAEETPDA